MPAWRVCLGLGIRLALGAVLVALVLLALLATTLWSLAHRVEGRPANRWS